MSEETTREYDRPVMAFFMGTVFTDPEYAPLNMVWRHTLMRMRDKAKLNVLCNLYLLSFLFLQFQF